MKITTKQTFNIFHLIIEADNTTIKEDVAGFNKQISPDLIDDLISAALEMNRFSGNSDTSFVKHILNKFTEDGVIDNLIEEQ